MPGSNFIHVSKIDPGHSFIYKVKLIFLLCFFIDDFEYLRCSEDID